MDATLPEAAGAVVRAAIERRTPAQRMRDALALSETIRALAIAELRRKYPNDSMRVSADSLDHWIDAPHVRPQLRSVQ